MHRLKNTLFTVIVLLTLSVSAGAQTAEETAAIAAQQATLKSCFDSKEVGCLIPKVFGGGIVLPVAQPGFHQAHFVGTKQFVESFLPLNTAIATQLALLPIVSPASGFTYSYDEATGAERRSAQTFGPILLERGETIGRGKVSAGINYQHFRFNEIDGNDLRRLPGVLQHVNAGRATGDVIVTTSDFDLRIDQSTFVGIVGLTPFLDVALAVPINDVRFNLTTDASLQRLDRDDPNCPPTDPSTPCHFFDPAAKQTSTTKAFPQTASAKGIGDATLRIKFALANSDNLAVSAVGDVRFPTGNERNFLGSGAWGVRPMAAITYKKGGLAPHVNLGFQWNGKSVLAGDLLAETKGDLPNTFYWGAGTDVSLVEDRFTLVFDAAGQWLFNSPQLSISNTTVTNNDLLGIQYPVTFPQVQSAVANYGVSHAAIGAKIRLSNRLLLTPNVTFSIDDGGLRQRALPLLGVSYVF